MNLGIVCGSILCQERMFSILIYILLSGLTCQKSLIMARTMICSSVWLSSAHLKQLQHVICSLPQSGQLPAPPSLCGAEPAGSSHPCPVRPWRDLAEPSFNEWVLEGNGKLGPGSPLSFIHLNWERRIRFLSRSYIFINFGSKPAW